MKIEPVQIGKLDGIYLAALSMLLTMSQQQQCEAAFAHCYDAEGNALFSDRVISRFAIMWSMSDCWLVSTEGTAYPVHKVKLLEQSKILGQVQAVALGLACMHDAACNVFVRACTTSVLMTFTQDRFSESRCCNYACVHYRCRGLLFDLPTSAKLQLDETAETTRLLISGMYDANSQVSWGNITSLQELARKYDVEDISLSCGRFLEAEEMSTTNLPRFIRLACRFNMDSLLQRCQDFIADSGNFRAIAK